MYTCVLRIILYLIVCCCFLFSRIKPTYMVVMFEDHYCNCCTCCSGYPNLTHSQLIKSSYSNSKCFVPTSGLRC